MPSKPRNGALNILQLIGNLEIGGAQEVVRTLSAYLTECGYPTVVCSFKDGPLRAEIERLGIPVEIIPGRHYSILTFPQYAREMRRIRSDLLRVVDKYQIDVVQTHLLRSLDFLVASLRSKSGRPLVFWTVHNANFTLRPEQLDGPRWLLKPKQAAHSLLYRVAAWRANGFIAVAGEVETSIAQSIRPDPEKVYVICNGVDTRRYPEQVDRDFILQDLDLPREAALLTVVGTLKEQKGHCVLIRALPPVIAERPDLHVLLAGDGELRAPLENQVRAAGLERNVHFLGNRMDVPALLAASDLFVLPSLWEGLPMALIEAMASGLPIVATRVSGTRQVVVDGESGILVPPGDERGLQEAIRSLLRSPGQARALGLAARKRVEESFSARKQAEEHIALYRREWERIGDG